jgi:hypothetical protein
MDYDIVCLHLIVVSSDERFEVYSGGREGAADPVVRYVYKPNHFGD